MVVGAFLFWVIRPGPGRSPLDFVPASAQLAVHLDTRLANPGARQALRYWSVSDLQRLGERGTELAQEAVDWAGFELDVKKDVLPWYGGELVVAMVGLEGERSLGPDSVVLIARTTDARRTRRTLDKGVEPFARNAAWKAGTGRVEGEKVAVWRAETGGPQMAYFTKDGCVFIAKRPEILAQCLRAGREATTRLTASAGYKASVAALPNESVVWAYLDASAAAQTAHDLLPAAMRGPAGIAREYLDPSHASVTATPSAPGRVAVLGVVPARDGVYLRGTYRGSKEEKPAKGTGKLAEVARFVPRDAFAYVALHLPQDWPSAVLPKQPAGRANMLFPFPASPLAMLGFDRAPTEIVLVVLPRAKGKDPGVALLAPVGQLPVPPRGMIAMQSPKLASAVLGKIAVWGSDAQALTQCQQAGASAQDRAPVEVAADTRLLAYLHPVGDVVFRLPHLNEVRISIADTAQGNEAEVTLLIPPKYLLGNGRTTRTPK